MMKLIIILSCVVWLCFSTLKVYLPLTAVKMMPDPIDYTISNFGNVPYGKTVIGHIEVPNVPQLCDLTNETIKQKKSTAEKIMLVKRGGGCKFAEKVINAQKMGADFVIIYDNAKSQSIVVMKNDGHGHLAQIPSIFIRKTDGDNLLKAIKEIGNEKLIVKLQFKLFQKQTADLVFWLDSSHRQTYVTLRDFYNKEYWTALQPAINFDIGFRIQIRQRLLFNFEKFLNLSHNCLQGKYKIYCLHVDLQSNQIKPQFINGKQILLQQLRAYYLFVQSKQNDLSYWWKYMIAFDEQLCLEDNMTRCSYEMMSRVGISDNVIMAIQSIVTEVKQNVTENKPNIMDEWDLGIDESGVLFFPEAAINGKTFYGLFKPFQVFEMVCKSVLSPPKQCTTFKKQAHFVPQQESNVWIYALLSIFIMAIGFFLALFIYSKVIRKEVNTQLNEEVNKTIESHYAMKERDNQGENYNKT